jgi:CMP-N-acetylneuraminic acid synthetase
MAYTIDAAKASRSIRRVIVSTDDPKVAALARELGAEAPFLRPSELAAHGVPLGKVLQHAVQWLDAQPGGPVDFIALLEITHPVRPAGLIDRVIEVALAEDLDSVFCAREERHQFWTFDDGGNLNRLRPGNETPRMDLQPLYMEMGGLVTVMRPHVPRAGERLGTRVGVVPVRDLSSLVDLRDEDGRRLAELLLPSSVPSGGSM